MRTTLTLDEDIAAKLKARARRSGESFRNVVNDILRRGLSSTTGTQQGKPFKVKARSLGELQPGFSLDSVAKLIEQAEGPGAR